MNGNLNNCRIPGRIFRRTFWLLGFLAVVGCPLTQAPENGDPGNGGPTTSPDIELRQGTLGISINGNATFGSVCINSINEIVFTIENVGDDDLHLTGTTDKVVKSGTDATLFEILSQPSSPIVPNGHSEFTVRFSTASSGEKSATFSVANDDSNEDPFVFTATATGLEPAAKIPVTGQTASQAQGDDGDLEKGVSWPVSRFEDNGDNTVTDHLTGLMWEKSPSGTACTWANAITHSNDLIIDIHSDWRLPNVNELESLLNAGESSSADWLNDQPFTNIQGDYYWTSTTFAGDTDYAWIVDMGYGSAGTACVGEGNKTGDPDIAGLKLYYAWAVRDDQSGSVSLPQTGQTVSFAAGDDGDLEKGVSWPSPRFVDNGNNTITDRLTGLMWQKTPSPSIRNWASALSFANDLTYIGYSDWRLPNRKELRSLINYGESNSADWLNNAEFAAVQSFYYWTSNPYPVGTQHAWIVFMTRGQVFLEYQNPSTSFWKPAWAVRGGQ